MDPTFTPLGLVMFVLSATVHAAFHVAGHESFRSLTIWRHRRLLRNHDVANALRESFLAAIAVLEKRFRGEHPDRKLRAAGRQAFDRVRASVADYPNADDQNLVGDGQIEALPTNDKAREQLTARVIAAAQPCPDQVESLIQECFADTFATAFMEIGIKTNPAAREAITHVLLMSMVESTNASVEAVRTLLEFVSEPVATREGQMSLQRSQEDFAERTDQHFAQVLLELSSVRELVEADRGPMLAYLILADSAGFPLLRQAIRKQLVTIGRHESNTVVLQNRRVSNEHATFHFSRDGIEIRDKSRHGIRLNGSLVTDRSHVRFGDWIEIEPYFLAFYPADDSHKFVQGSFVTDR